MIFGELVDVVFLNSVDIDSINSTCDVEIAMQVDRFVQGRAIPVVLIEF